MPSKVKNELIRTSKKTVKGRLSKEIEKKTRTIARITTACTARIKKAVTKSASTKLTSLTGVIKERKLAGLFLSNKINVGEISKAVNIITRTIKTGNK